MKEHSPTLNPDLINELNALIPEQQAAGLLALMLNKDSTAEERDTAIQDIIAALDWDAHSEQIGQLLARFLPIEQLVPDIYADWRPIVSDAMFFIGSRLSAKRLLPKLLEQVMLPAETTLEQRLISFIAQMPSLQKLGQIIARNRNLDPGFRAELIRLENEIRDVDPQQIKTAIKQQLGARLKTYKVEIEALIHAEASVCALMRFSWRDQSNNKQQGVFKVLKPYIKDYFTEEMQLLQGLPDFLDEQRKRHVLTEVNLHDVFDDIRSLLEQELDSINEQANIKLAYNHYKAVKGVRVPRLIEALSAPGLTAMSFEEGAKVTDAYANKNTQRKALAYRMIEALIAKPLFAAEEEAFFHADPHAGNLFADEDNNELLIFDWALTERLSRDQRRKMLLLISAVMLRDEALINKTIIELSKDDLSKDQTRSDAVEHKVSQFIKQLSVYNLPGIKDVLTLLDELLLSGINFSTPLLIFRKVLLTLDGVLHDVAEQVSMEAVLTGYVMENWTNDIYGMNFMQQSQLNFQMPLLSTDALSLVWSAQWYAYRAAFQTCEQMLIRSND